MHSADARDRAMGWYMWETIDAAVPKGRDSTGLPDLNLSVARFIQPHCHHFSLTLHPSIPMPKEAEPPGDK